MIVRVFEGSGWADAVERGDFDFDEVPRAGEVLAIGDGDRWYAARVLGIVHRIADGATADIALLVDDVREGPRGAEALPLVLLDDTASGEAPAPAAPPPAPPAPPARGPWG